MDERARDDVWAAPGGPGAAGQAQPALPHAPYGQAPYAPPQPTGPWPEQPWGSPPATYGQHGPPYGQQPVAARPGWESVQPLPPRRTGPRSALLAGALAVVLLAVGAVTVSERREAAHDAQVRAAVTARLPALQAFVERERGLPFLRPVDVEVLEGDAFLDALFSGEQEGGPQGESPADADATFRALGLLADDEDLDSSTEDALSDGVSGFYDPETSRLVVRGGDLTPSVELTLVHELTHALQDQHFDLSRPDVDASQDERSLAFAALVEGDATRVEEAWYGEQSAEVQDAVDEAEAAYGDGDAPDAVLALLGFPYWAGPSYVTDVLHTKGQRGLDEAFRTPPTSSEQVMYPDAGAPLAVPAPVGGPAGEQVDAGVMGELGLLLLIGASDEEADEDEGPPPLGWGGDAYVTTDGERGTCTTADVVLDDAPAAERVLARLQEWAAGQDDATVEPHGTDGLRLVACSG